MQYTFKNGNTLSITYDGAIHIDEEHWVTTTKENSPDGKGHHFLVNENGDIVKGLGGWRPINTIEELDNYAKNKGVEIDAKIKKMGLANAKHIVDTTTNIIENTFPCLKGFVKQINIHKCGENTWMRMGKLGTLEINSYYNSEDGIAKMKQELIKCSSGWTENEEYYQPQSFNDFKYINGHFNPKNCNTIESIIAHELGHALAFKVEKTKYPDNKTVMANFSQWEKDMKNKTIQKEILKEAKKRLKSQPKYLPAVSKYATKNVDEAIAECVSEWYINRENATELSKKVVEVLNERLNGGINV